MKLTDKLNNINSYPFHMPGHKRNESLDIIGSNIDITEIDGFDNLHNASEVLLDLENELTKLFESKKSIISVNGSTCGILASISAVCNRNDTILIARNCHKSVYNACLINELHIEYIEPEFDKSIGVFTKVTQEILDEALKKHPNAKAIVITSPTYEGIVSSIKADIPVIVDSAHGSHFGFANYLPKRSCGDIVINSLHKTLPALTQTAVININNEKLIASVKKYMDIFETSSPSYILLSSIDKCVDFLNDSEKQFAEYKTILDGFYERIVKLDNIKLFKNDDITRIIISADGYSGYELSEHLRNNGIEVEGAGIGYVILISSVCDTKDGFDRLYNALKLIEKRKPIDFSLNKPSTPYKKMEQYEINEVTPTPLNEAIGKVAGESVFAYPPDIPIITAGEVITQDIVDYIMNLINNGVNVLNDSNFKPNIILTNKE